MIDYLKWEIRRDIPVTEVKLDKLNPRMPENSDDLTQEDILNLMVDDYKIIELAESIVAKGFMPLDNMVITYEDNVPVVLEGNRRIAALKLLINPSSAPVKERHKYEALNSRIDTSIIMNPSFVIAPSREAASSLILDRHTVATEIPWTPIMQAEFHRDILWKRNLDFPNKEILEEYNLKKSDMTNSLLRLALYERACSYSYDSSIGKKVKDKLHFEITTLERLILPPVSQTAFKYKIEDGKFLIEDENLFNDFIRSVVIHMYKPIERLSKITSRTTNTIEQIAKYLEAIKREISLSIQTGKKQSSNYEQSSSDNEEPTFSRNTSIPAHIDIEDSGHDISSFPPAHPRPKTQRKTVHSNELRFEYNSPANQRIYDELGRIPVKEAPSCVTISIRVLLERTIKSYLSKSKKRSIPVIVNGNTTKVPISDAKFGEIIDWMIRDDVDIICDHGVKKTLKKFKRAENSNVISLGMLNSVVHEPFQVIHKDSVFLIWDNLAPIFEYFMNRPETNAEGMAMHNQK